MTATKARKKRLEAPAGVVLAPGDLAGLDALEAEAVGVFCFSDVRPLRGVAGYLDWRLCGALSRCVEAGFFHGRSGETMMVPTSGRLGSRRVFAFGLGSSAECGRSVMSRVSCDAFDVMKRAGVKRVAFAAPVGAVNEDAQAVFVQAVAEALPGKVDRVLVES